MSTLTEQTPGTEFTRWNNEATTHMRRTFGGLALVGVGLVVERLGLPVDLAIDWAETAIGYSTILLGVEVTAIESWSWGRARGLASAAYGQTPRSNQPRPEVPYDQGVVTSTAAEDAVQMPPAYDQGAEVQDVVDNTVFAPET